MADRSTRCATRSPIPLTAARTAFSRWIASTASWTLVLFAFSSRILTIFSENARTSARESSRAGAALGGAFSRFTAGGVGTFALVSGVRRRVSAGVDFSASPVGCGANLSPLTRSTTAIGAIRTAGGIKESQATPRTNVTAWSAPDRPNIFLKRRSPGSMAMGAPYRSSGSVTIPSFSIPAFRTSAMTFTTNPYGTARSARK